MLIEKQLSERDYYETMLSLLIFFKLTKLEKSILVEMLLKGTKEVNIDTREYIRKVLNKDKYTTNNCIKQLRTKKVFLDKEDVNRVYYINPIIIDAINSKEISFKFNVNDYN